MSNMLVTLANAFMATKPYLSRDIGVTVDEIIKSGSAYLETMENERCADGYNPDLIQRIDYYFNAQGRKGNDGQYFYYQNVGSDFVSWLTDHFQSYSMQLLKEKKHG